MKKAIKLVAFIFEQLSYILVLLRRLWADKNGAMNYVCPYRCTNYLVDSQFTQTDSHSYFTYSLVSVPLSNLLSSSLSDGGGLGSGLMG